MNDNEKLIEEAAAAAQEATRQKHRPTWRKLPEYVKENYRAHARAALAVFEKAHNPTVDEREALETVIAVTWRDMYSTPTDRDFADAILAAGFRRSEVPESSAGRELTPCGNLVCTGCRVCGCPALGIEPQGEPSEAQVDAVAAAIAVAADADYWTDEIAEWEGAEAWYREAYPNEHPHMAYEDREQFRKQARAALRAAGGVR